MRKFLVVIAALALSGCASLPPQVLTQTKYVTPQVPESLYNCPVLKQYPAVAKLKDSDVARLILTLSKNNVTCKNSLDAVKAYLAGVKSVVH